MKKLAVCLLATFVGVGLAQLGPSTSHAQNATVPPRVGKILGIMPALGVKTGLPVATGQPGSGALYYNGGPVMTTNKVYTIFWAPNGYAFDPTYQSQINGFFKDVSADNGKNSTAYDATTQYCSNPSVGATDCSAPASGPNIQYNTTFESTTVDTNALPPLDPVNCPDTPVAATGGVDRTNPAQTPPPNGNGYCVTDSQVQQEISNVIKANRWSVDNNTEFFMYTAPNIGTCFPNTVGQSVGNVGTSATAPFCSFSTFCAYHSWYFDSTVNPNSQIVYANMPYAYQTRGKSPTCDSKMYPNGNGGPDAADPEINVTSHEHIESITDPFGTGWWDSNANDSSAGMEIGDMCAYVYGTLHGPAAPSVNVPAYGTVQTPGSGTYDQEWNQTINGHHYLAQQEWSNADSNVPARAGNGCVSAEKPLFTVTPNVGYPTAPFKIDHGLFFQSGETATFTFTSAGSSTPETLATVIADSTGHVAKIRTTVPADALPGDGTVAGTGSLSGSSGTATFTVPAP